MALSTAVFATLGLTAVVAAAVTALAWRHRGKPGGVPLFGLMLAVTWWTATYAGELYATELGTKLLFARLQWFGTVWVPVGWLLFALEYSGHDEYVDARLLAWLSVVPTASIVAVWTNGIHGLVRRSPDIIEQGDLLLLDQQWGPVFWLAIGYTYLLGLIGSFLLVQLAATSPTLFRDQIAAMLVAALAPWVSNVLYVTDMVPVRNLDPTPVAFTVTGLAALGAITRFRLLRVSTVPSRLARALVVRNMEDGVVVVDTAGRIVDANDSATEILGGGPVVGENAADLVPGFDGRVGPGAEGEQRVGPQTVVSVPVGDDERYYDVRISELRDHHDRVIGAVAVFRDVTETRRHQQRLDVLNRVLRHNLRNEMNVVHGYAEELEGADPDGSALATKVKEKALSIVDLGDTARAIEEILEDEGRTGRLRVEDAVATVVDRVGEEYPDVAFTVEAVPDRTVTAEWPIEPILEQLVENAAEHNDAASPVVRVRATVEDDRLTLSVADNGPGLPETERLVLETESETQTRHGSGLGLWLVALGTRELGGEVSVRGSQPRGTVMTVTVPCVVEPASGDPATAATDGDAGAAAEPAIDPDPGTAGRDGDGGDHDPETRAGGRDAGGPDAGGAETRSDGERNADGHRTADAG